MNKERTRKFKYYYFHQKDGSHVTCAVSSYHNKNYIGKATCNINDVYDAEFGRTLAAAKCFLKIKKARYRYLQQLWLDSLTTRSIAEMKEESLRSLSQQAYAELNSVTRTVHLLQTEPVS